MTELREQWDKLTRGEKDSLALKWGVSCVGEPPEPTADVELEKIPQSQWDAVVQKTVPDRKVTPEKTKERKAKKEVRVEKPKKTKEPKLGAKKKSKK